MHMYIYIYIYIKNQQTDLIRIITLNIGNMRCTVPRIGCRIFLTGNF